MMTLLELHIQRGPFHQHRGEDGKSQTIHSCNAGESAFNSGVANGICASGVASGVCASDPHVSTTHWLRTSEPQIFRARPQCLCNLLSKIGRRKQ